VAKIVLRLDDIHPRMNRDNFDRFVYGVEAIGVKGLLGVIPQCQDDKLNRSPEDPAFWDRIRSLREKGWVVAQHGLTHVYDQVAPTFLGRKSRSEFAGHTLQEQIARLEQGADLLADQGLRSDVFMAPSHSFDRRTLAALEATKFRFVTDGYGFWPYSVGRLIFVPQLASSPHGLPFGVYTTCFHLDNLKDEQIDRALEQVRRHTVLPFYEAAALHSPAGLSTVLRKGTEGFLRSWRRLRHAG